MPANNNRELRGVGHEVDFSEVVQDVHSYLVNLEGFRFGEIAGPRLPINVASHGLDRRQGTQGVEDRGFADVPAVNDQLRATERLERLRPEEPVGIRNHTDAAPSHG